MKGQTNVPRLTKVILMVGVVNPIKTPRVTVVRPCMCVFVCDCLC